MQITGEIDWKEARALDQREEFGAVRSLTSKLSGGERKESYSDLDVSLPFHWETMTGKKMGGHNLSKSSSQEFEFNMSGAMPPATTDASDYVLQDGISPADDLFYKGQLLPLHLPKRLQMVQKLSSPSHKHSDPSSVTVSCFFHPTTLKYSPRLGSDEGYLGSALVNSRSSSFHSQSSTNFWESDSPVSSGELDSGDSSSSRDSSGSCQDVQQQPPEKQPALNFNDHDPSSPFRHGHAQDKPLASSWLRTPLKWKMFFGLKKQPQSGGKCNSVFGSGRSSKAAGSSLSAEQKLSGSRKDSEDSKAAGVVAEDSKVGLQKYLSILKPLTLRGAPPRTGDSNRMVDIKAKTSFSGTLVMSSPMHPSSSSSSSSSAKPHKSSFSSEMRCRSPTMPSFSGNLRVPSFSRSSKASLNATHAAASPNHSGLLVNNSPSCMAELHSSIQGAIAHCKQSQSVVI